MADFHHLPSINFLQINEENGVLKWHLSPGISNVHGSSSQNPTPSCLSHSDCQSFVWHTSILVFNNHNNLWFLDTNPTQIRTTTTTTVPFSLHILVPCDSFAPIINTRGPQTVCMDLSRTRDPLTHRFAPPTT